MSVLIVIFLSFCCFAVLYVFFDYVFAKKERKMRHILGLDESYLRFLEAEYKKVKSLYDEAELALQKAKNKQIKNLVPPNEVKK